MTDIDKMTLPQIKAEIEERGWEYEITARCGVTDDDLPDCDYTPLCQIRKEGDNNGYCYSIEGEFFGKTKLEAARAALRYVREEQKS